MKNYSNMFMDIAKRTAIESNCVKYKVGSVIVKDNRIILQGYNGTVSGFLNCCTKFENLDMDVKEDRETHHKWSSSFEVHSEMNVICYAARKGISLEGTTIYCTHSPCNNCLKHLIQAGVKKMVFEFDYIEKLNFKDREELLKLIEVEHYK